MKGKRSGHSLIGVDVGRRTIKAAQLLRADGAYHVSALSALPRPETERDVSEADALALKEIFRRQGFVGRGVVLAAPEDRLMEAALELPAKVADAPVEQIVRMEMSRLHGVAPDSFEMAYWEFRGANGSRPLMQTLAVGCPHAAANDFLDVFEKAGFRVAALDVRIAAATRACGPLLLAAPQITAVVDLGWRCTSVLFVCGTSIIYERSLQAAALGELTSKLMEAFKIPFESAYQILGAVGPIPEELPQTYDRESLDAIRKHTTTHFDRLLDELEVPLSYANHQFAGEGVRRVLLIGGGAAVPQLAPYFEKRLGVEVRRASPCDLLDTPPALTMKAGNPTLTVALGLAMSGGI